MPEKPTYAELAEQIKSFEKAESERREIEKKLREMESYQRALLDAVSDTLFLMKPDGTILFANHGLANNLGMPFSKIVGKKAYELVPREVALNRQIALDKALETGSAVEINDMHSGRNIESRIFPIKDKLGEVTHLAVFARDTTQNRELEKRVAMHTAELQQANRDLMEKSLDLEARSVSLEEANTALKRLLGEYMEHRSVLEEKVTSNINELIRPLLSNLRDGKLSFRQCRLLTAIESSLDHILSPLSRRFILEGNRLTPTEIRVTGFIRQGKSTKEIADIMGVATSTVDYHRRNIRKKLRLVNKQVNLQSYLQSLL